MQFYIANFKAKTISALNAILYCKRQGKTDKCVKGNFYIANLKVRMISALKFSQM